MAPLFAAGSVTGYEVGVTTAHARCHSSSLHRCAPTDAHAACACGAVTSVHGCTPFFEHGSDAIVPWLFAFESGRDASNCMIWWPVAIVIQLWPGKLPVLAPLSMTPSQSSSRPLQLSACAVCPGVVIMQVTPFLVALQMLVPLPWQMPLPVSWQTWPRVGNGSSMRPLQSLSLPSHCDSGTMLPLASVDTVGG